MNGECDKQDKRREARYPTNDAVRVSVAPHEEKGPAKILNISRNGLQLEIGYRLLIGARVEILTTGGIEIFGEIRYCHQVGELFHAGVLIHDAISGKPHEHVDDDQLSLHVTGRGLSATEVPTNLKEHLGQCAECRSGLAETEEMIRRTGGRLPAVP